MLEHYLRCRAVGQFPDDELVQVNATLLDGAFRAADLNNINRVVSTAAGELGTMLGRALRRTK